MTIKGTNDGTHREQIKCATMCETMNKERKQRKKTVNCK